MMKMEIHDRPAVSADLAAATGLVDENPSDLVVAPSDGFADAALAAPANSLAGLIPVELDESVPAALPQRSGALRLRWPAGSGDEGSMGHERMFVLDSDGVGRLGLEPRPEGLTCRTGSRRPRRLAARCGLDHLFTLGSTLGRAAYGL